MMTPSTPTTTWPGLDRMLPHRDALLDSRRMATRLAHALGASSRARIDGCECVHVDYQAGDSLRVLYALDIEGQRRFVATRMFREGRSAEAFAGAIAASGVTAAAHDPELDSVFWRFPHDRRLRGLSALDTTTVPVDLAQLVPIEWASSRLVAYAPETSATAACLDRAGRPRASVTLFADDQAARDHAYVEALCASLDPGDPLLSVPRPLACSAEHRLLWLEAREGRSLADLLGLAGQDRTPQTSQEEQGALWRFGAALARFHDCAVPGAPVFTAFDDDHLVTGAQTLARLRPDVEDMVFELVSDLIARRTWIDNDCACLHGGVRPNDVLIGDAVVTLVNVEHLAIGPSAADLGSFLASLASQEMAGGVPRATYVERGEAVIAGYESRGRCLPRSLTWHMAAALFIEHAVRAVTRLDASGLTHLHALLVHAQALMDGKTAFSIPRTGRSFTARFGARPQC